MLSIKLHDMLIRRCRSTNKQNEKFLKAGSTNSCRRERWMGSQRRKRFPERDKQSNKKGSFNKLWSSGFTYPDKRTRESDRHFEAKASFTPRIYYGISVLSVVYRYDYMAVPSLITLYVYTALDLSNSHENAWSHRISRGSSYGVPAKDFLLFLFFL